MLERLRSRFKRPGPAGLPETLRAFHLSGRPIAESGVSPEEIGVEVLCTPLR